MAGTEVCWYHDRIGLVYLATFYGRHWCPKCGKFQVVAMCTDCKKNYDGYIRAHGKYTWGCENCGAEMDRRVVGSV